MALSPDQVTPVAFWFLRHGETDWNAKDLSQGNVDIPLNENGLAQARSASLLLRNRGIRGIVCSPLSRAKVTADIAGATLGLPVEVEDGLREVSFGVKEGEPMAGWLPHWIQGEMTPEGAESFAALTHRAIAAVNRAIARPPVVLVVGHGAMFRALRGAMGHEPNYRTRNAIPVWCEPPAGGTGRWGISYAE
ncbi:histidine phosphatase family protein [Rhodopila sp.]|uniref:histidine phosphatase family protein n=1 Tax=Rhodopila sp. TaxID=2480087 RepID=UPI003D0B61A8